MIDPGLKGDAYADKPYLYGPALSSWNYFNVGEKTDNVANGPVNTNGSAMTSHFHDEVIEEGGEGSGEEIRQELSIPDQPDQRKKWFLDQRNRQAFEFEAGRLYKADFGNPYIVFNGEPSTSNASILFSYLFHCPLLSVISSSPCLICHVSRFLSPTSRVHPSRYQIC